VFQPAEEPLPPGWVYLIRDVGLHRTLSFDPMLFFNELLVDFGIPTGSSDEAHESRLSRVVSRHKRLAIQSVRIPAFLPIHSPAEHSLHIAKDS
jgi:hypothetical protein